MRSRDTVSKFEYVSIFTYVSKCVHVNGASEYKGSCIQNFGSALTRVSSTHLEPLLKTPDQSDTESSADDRTSSVS